MYYDSLREQGEKLNIFGSGSAANLLGNDESQLANLKRGPIAGALNAKKMRKVLGANPIPGVSQPANKKQAPIDEKKELMRLKREIREKKALEKRLAELENEAQLKQKQYKEKFGEQPNQPIAAQK